MQLFIRKTIIFLSVPMVLGIPLFFLVDTWAKAKMNEHVLNPEITTAFVGDSHIQCAINDSLIPYSISFAEASESFYFSYYKLKTLLQAKSSVRQVFIGLSYHSFSKYYERFVCGDWSLATAPKYYNFLPNNEQLKMIYWNSDNFLSFTNTVFKKGLKSANETGDHRFGDGFVNSFNQIKAQDSSITKRIRFQYYTKGEINVFSSMNLDYLDKIIALCKENNIRLRFINTPLHSKYYAKVPESFKAKLRDLVLKKHLDYIDLGSLPMDDDCFTPDGDHVTYKGALLTTKAFSAAISNIDIIPDNQN